MSWYLIFREGYFEAPCILPFVEACEMAGGGVFSILGAQGGHLGGKLAHLGELFTASRNKGPGSRSTHVFTVHAHVCSTGTGCFLMGPRWLIYPILSYPIPTLAVVPECNCFFLLSDVISFLGNRESSGSHLEVVNTDLAHDTRTSDFQ